MKYRLMDIGLTDYEQAYSLQHKLVNACRRDECGNVLLLLEHPSIFTIGRRGSFDNLLCNQELLKEYNIDLRYVDRGGDITFHGKGQLVAYPIFNLREYKCDLHKYLRALEKVVIDLLSIYNIRANRIEGRTGVWVGERKIASIGIGVRNWITYHGLSLNVNPDLKFFSLINPCGFKDIQMTSLEETLGGNISTDEIKPYLIKMFEDTFGLEALN